MSAVGPTPTSERWISGVEPSTAPQSGMPVPFFFHKATAAEFRRLRTRESDVILSSLAKGGTSWTHKILWSLLHGFDDAGAPVASSATKSIGASGQVYPEALPLDSPSSPASDEPPKEAMRRGFFGDWSYGELLEQPEPRLFSTHLFGSEYLPASLVDAGPEGAGRLVIVLRNLKDVLVSLHYFRGEPKDGWLGNEHGPGSLARFIEPDCPNAYGSVFRVVRDSDALQRALDPTGRVLVIYFEQLKSNLPAEVERMASFLGLDLTAAKRDAVVAAASFGAMKSGGGLTQKAGLLRKGEIGDWRNHMGEAEWARFDAAFDEQLAGCALAEPMRAYQ